MQKLTKRHATIQDVENVKPKKIPKQSSLPSKKIDEQFRGVRSTEVIRISRCLMGKEICVLNGNEDMSKSEIEKLVLAHAATLIQNPGPKTFCVIVGNAEKVFRFTKISNGVINIFFNNVFCFRYQSFLKL